MSRWSKRALMLLVAAAVVGGGAVWYLRGDTTAAATFRTAAVGRDDVVAAITASGTLRPEEQIDIGAQVAGQIAAFGTDEAGKTIDYSSQVAEGALLARIDDALYAAEVTEAEAQVKQAKAGIRRAEADLLQLRAKLFQAERDWQRAERLGPSDALAEASYDAYRAAFDTAKANITVGEAAIEQAKATADQADAALKRAQRNLAYCTIRSPVDGVVIDRRVNIGQTVVASLNAPSLFLIAKDLTRMQLWVAVNEADVGNIRPGQPVTFTVDTFPGRTFRGQVSRIRLNASMTQNVVSYVVEVTTDNADRTLIPYLTANVQFEVSRKDDVLVVPNSALRWSPDPEQIAPDARQPEPTTSASDGDRRGGGGGNRGEGGRPERSGGPGGDPPDVERPAGQGTVWVRAGQFVRPLPVRTGVTDGIMTEVSGDGLTEGTEVVTGEVSPDADGARAAGTNPFAPPPMRRFGGGGPRR